MTPHDAIRESIPDLLSGHLDPRAARDVGSHLASCAECAALADSLRELVDGFRAGGLDLLSPHPEPESLRRLALGTLGDPQVARHVETCASCSLELEVHRESPRSARVLPFARKRRSEAWLPFASPRTWMMPASLAAMLVVGLGLGLLYRPVAGPEGDLAASATSPWSGPVRLVVLEQPLRSGSEAPSFMVPAGQPYVPLASPLPLDAALDDRAAVRFELRSASGRVVWATSVEAGEIRAAVRAAGVVTLLVPSGVLEPGRHFLSARPDGVDEAVLDVTFEVER